jgi:hypothetical protein
MDRRRSTLNVRVAVVISLCFGCSGSSNQGSITTEVPFQQVSDTRSTAQPLLGPFMSRNCSNMVPSGSYMTIPFNWTTNNLVRSPVDLTNYARKMYHERFLIGNHYIADIGFEFPHFDVALDGSSASWAWGNGWYLHSNFKSGQNRLHLDGNRGLVTVFAPLAPGELATSGLLQTFSDMSGATRSGYRIENVYVRCSPTSSPQPPPVDLDSMAKWSTSGKPELSIFDGILVGADDAVFFKIDGRGHEFPESREHWTFVLDGPSGDFDLYIKRGSVPTKDDFDYASNGPGSREVVRLPFTENGGGQVYFGVVHSKSGSGRFTLTAHSTMRQHARELSVGVRFSPTPAQLDVMRNYLRNGFRRFFGMTEGLMYVRRVKFYTSPTLGLCDCAGVCDICFSSSPHESNRAYCETTFKRMVLYASSWPDLPQVLAHEMGHCVLELDDEYEDHCAHSDSKCTRSIMGTTRQALGAHNLCHSKSHRASTDPVGHVCDECESGCFAAPGVQLVCQTCAKSHAFGSIGGNPEDPAWANIPHFLAGHGHRQEYDPRSFANFDPLDVVFDMQ